MSSAADHGVDAELEGVAPERIAQYLRATLATVSDSSSSPGSRPGWSGPYGEAIAAVTAACADLGSGDLPGAYLALRAADTALHEAADR